MKTSESPVIEYVFKYIGIYSHSSDELSSFDSSLLDVSSDSVLEKKNLNNTKVVTESMWTHLPRLSQEIRYDSYALLED
jgi:hypothetical protein